MQKKYMSKKKKKHIPKWGGDIFLSACTHFLQSPLEVCAGPQVLSYGLAVQRERAEQLHRVQPPACAIVMATGAACIGTLSPVDGVHVSERSPGGPAVREGLTLEFS